MKRFRRPRFFWEKGNGGNGNGKKARRPRKILFEPLEPRFLLSSEPFLNTTEAGFTGGEIVSDGSMTAIKQGLEQLQTALYGITSSGDYAAKTNLDLPGLLDYTDPAHPKAPKLSDLLTQDFDAAFGTYLVGNVPGAGQTNITNLETLIDGLDTYYEDKDGDGTAEPYAVTIGNYNLSISNVDGRYVDVANFSAAGNDYELVFDLTFTLTQITPDTYSFDLGRNADIFGLKIPTDPSSPDYPKVQLTSSMSFELSFGLGLNIQDTSYDEEIPNPNPPPDTITQHVQQITVTTDTANFFVGDDTSFTAGAEVANTDGGAAGIDNLAFDLRVGFLDAAVSGGHLDLTAYATVDFQDPGTGTYPTAAGHDDGHIDYSELGGTVGSLFEMTTSGQLNANLPVTVDALPGGSTPFFDPAGDQRIKFLGLDPFEPDYGLDGSGDPRTAPAITLENFEALLPFRNINADGVVGLLSQFQGWLDTFGDTQVFTSLNLPFAKETLAGVLDYSGMMDTKVFDQIAPKDASGSRAPNFATVQELAGKLATVEGNDMVSLSPTYGYDSANQDTFGELTFTLSLNYTDYDWNQDGQPLGTAPIDFNLNLGDLAGLKTSAESTVQVSITPDAGLDFTFGIDLDVEHPIALTPSLLDAATILGLMDSGGNPVDSNLADTVKFDLVVGSLGVIAVTLAPPPADSPWADLDALANALDSSIAGALAAAGLSGVDIGVSVVNNRLVLSSGDVVYLKITDKSGNLREELGFQNGQASSKTQTPQNGILSGDAVFNLSVGNITIPVTVAQADTIDNEVLATGKLDVKASVANLVADIQSAIDNAISAYNGAHDPDVAGAAAVNAFGPTFSISSSDATFLKLSGLNAVATRELGLQEGQLASQLQVTGNRDLTIRSGDFAVADSGGISDDVIFQVVATKGSTSYTYNVVLPCADALELGFTDGQAGYGTVQAANTNALLSTLVPSTFLLGVSTSVLGFTEGQTAVDELTAAAAPVPAGEPVSLTFNLTTGGKTYAINLDSDNASLDDLVADLNDAFHSHATWNGVRTDLSGVVEAKKDGGKIKLDLTDSEATLMVSRVTTPVEFKINLPVSWNAGLGFDDDGGLHDDLDAALADAHYYQSGAAADLSTRIAVSYDSGAHRISFSATDPNPASVYLRITSLGTTQDNHSTLDLAADLSRALSRARATTAGVPDLDTLVQAGAIAVDANGDGQFGGEFDAYQLALAGRDSALLDSLHLTDVEGLNSALKFNAGTYAVTGPRSTGQLIGDAVFKLTLDDGTGPKNYEVTVPEAQTGDNDSITDLVADLNQALTTAKLVSTGATVDLSGKLAAGLAGGSIVLASTNGGFLLKIIDANPEAKNQLGLDKGLVATLVTQTPQFFIKNATLKGGASVAISETDPTKPAVEGHFGFVGLNIDDIAGTIAGNFELNLAGATELGLSELFDQLTDSAQLQAYRRNLTFTGTPGGVVTLSGLHLMAGADSDLLTIPDGQAIQIDLKDFRNLVLGTNLFLDDNTLDAAHDLAGLGDLVKFTEIGFDDVTAALQGLADILKGLADPASGYAFDFLAKPLEVLGVTLNDLLGYLDQFEQAAAALNTSLKELLAKGNPNDVGLLGFDEAAAGGVITALKAVPLSNFSPSHDIQFYLVVATAGGKETYVVTLEQARMLGNASLGDLGLDINDALTKARKLIDGTQADISGLVEAGSDGDRLTLTAQGAATGLSVASLPFNTPNAGALLQDVEQLLRAAFGLPTDDPAIDLALDGTFLKIDLSIKSSFFGSLPLNIDLPKLAAEAGLELPENVLNLSGGAGMSADFTFQLDLDLGIKLADPTEIYLYDSSKLELTGAAKAENVTFTGAIGPVGLFVKDGSAVFDADGKADTNEKAAFTIDLASLNDPDHKFLVTDLLDAGIWSQLQPTLAAGGGLNLPVYFPTTSASDYLGNLAFQVGIATDDATPAPFDVKFTYSGLEFPDLSKIDFDFSNLNILSLLVEGFDLLLTTLQNTMSGEFAGLSLPLIGDSLKDGATFIEDFRGTVVAKLKELAQYANPAQAIGLMQQVLFNTLGAFEPGDALGLILDPNWDGNPSLDYHDIPYLQTGSASDISGIQFNLHLGGSKTFGIPGFDVGLPGLGLEFDGATTITLGWDLLLVFGVSKTDGFYFDTNPLNDFGGSAPTRHGTSTAMTTPLEVYFDFNLGNSISGNLLFLTLTATDENPGPELSADFKLGVAGPEKMSFFQLSDLDLTPEFSVFADLDLGLDLKFGGSAVFPYLSSDFKLDWGLGSAAGAEHPSTPLIEFSDIRLNLGSFFSNVIGPIVERIQDFTDPLQPLIDVITYPIPVISDLAGQPITLVDIAEIFGEVDLSLVEDVASIITMINSIPTGAEGVYISLSEGGFTLGGEGGLDLTKPNSMDAVRAGSGFNGLPGLENVQNFINGISGGDGLFSGDELTGMVTGSGNTSGAASFTKSLANGDFGGFAFPILQDPASIIGVLFGRPIDIITYDLRPLYFSFEYSQFFPICGPLGAELTGGLSITIDTAFGFDTYGIQQFVEGGYKYPMDIFNGFYINDMDPNNPTVDIPEISFTGKITGAAVLNLGVAKGGVGGGIFVTVDFDLDDPNNDGKLRIPELIGNLEYGWETLGPLAPLALFEITTTIEAKLIAFIEILFVFKFETQIGPSIPILEYTIGVDPPPVLADEMGGGLLRLNVGPNADSRTYEDLSDGNESLTITGDGSAVTVSGFGTSKTYYGVTSIEADCGAGNDYLDASGLVGVPVKFLGGEGDDTLLSGSGADSIVGGPGNDSLAGGDGADTILGLAGADTIAGQGGNDYLVGGEDDDNISGGDGNDTILGDAGNDSLAGDAGNDIIQGMAGNDTIHGGEGDDTLDGALGDDQLYGDDGADVMAGGAGFDVMEGNAGPDKIWGDSSFKFNPDQTLTVNMNDVGSFTQVAGYNLSGADSIKGGTEDDLIFGEGNNDYIQGEEGNDTVYGGDGGDLIYGDKDGDTVSGDQNNDVLFGQKDSDTVFGNQGNDLVLGDEWVKVTQLDQIPTNLVGVLQEGGVGSDVLFGDDGAVEVFSVADLGLDAGTIIPRLHKAIYTQNPGQSGDDTVRGDAGEDLLFGGPGADKVLGGPGNDVMLGDMGRIDFQYLSEENGVIKKKYSGFLKIATPDPEVPAELEAATTGGVDDMAGQDGDDILLGGPAGDLMYGDAAGPGVDVDGYDILIGDGGEIVYVDGMAGVIDYLAATHTLPGTGGADELHGQLNDDIILGGLYGDTLTGDQDDDILLGDNGKVDFTYDNTDKVNRLTKVETTDAGFGGADNIHGNVGDDIALGGTAGDNIYGNDGSDILLGDNGVINFIKPLGQDGEIVAFNGAVSDIATSDTADDTGGADTVEGNAGPDIILGGVNGDPASPDFLYGDAASPTPAADASDIILGDNGLLDFTYGLDTIPATLDLIHSATDGKGGADTISGNAAGDVIFGGTGGDSIYGDDDSASAAAADGEDIILGDNGDIFLLVDADGRLPVRTTAVDLIKTTDTTDDSGGQDTVHGNAAGDIILGGVLGDYLYGDAEYLEEETPPGYDGNDVILGDNGLLDFSYDDAGDTDLATLDLVRSSLELIGGADTISGNRGDDVAVGGFAGDTIYGDDPYATAGAADTRDLLLGDNADIFTRTGLPDAGGLTGGELFLLGDPVRTIVTTDSEDSTGGVDTISGNADADFIAGGVLGDTLYGDRETPSATTTADDGDDLILGDNARFEWASNGDFGELGTVDFDHLENASLLAYYNAWKADPANRDTDLGTLDLVTTIDPNLGGRDTIYGDAGKDVVFGGTDSDLIYGDDGTLDEAVASANNDLLFGDHGRLYPQHSVIATFPSRNYFAIDTADADGGEGDRMYGEEGDDIMLGQQGDDRMWGGSGNDDMIGGHNVIGGMDELSEDEADIIATVNPPINDLMDGGSGDDVVAGDNATIWRKAATDSLRFQDLVGDLMYFAYPEPTSNIPNTDYDYGDPYVTFAPQNDPRVRTYGWEITILDHDATIESSDAAAPGRYGDDYLAGNADYDLLFGELGNDVMQGDGSISEDNPAGNNIQTAVMVTDGGGDTDQTLYFNVFEAASDGDDYLEGGGGADTMYGGLGQDDIIGGSSSLFGLNNDDPEVAAWLRPDVSDVIYGGAATRTDYDYLMTETESDPKLIDIYDVRHARDADVIMGDNAVIYRLVDVVDQATGATQYKTFNYDYPYDPPGDTFDPIYQGYSADLRIIPRAVELLDYDPGEFGRVGDGVDDGIAQGGREVIHGESGDDIIHGMVGHDIIYAESEDDDVYGEAGSDWITGGTGDDAVLGDDGLIFTSRNSYPDGNKDKPLDEPLYGIAAPPTLNELVETPGDIQRSIINVANQLKKTVDLTPYDYDDTLGETGWDDIIYGGRGHDTLHGCAGDDAVSGAEALFGDVAVLMDNDSNPDTLEVVRFDYNNPFKEYNPDKGDFLAFGVWADPTLKKDKRADQFALYDEYDPLRKIMLDADADEQHIKETEFLLNFAAFTDPADQLGSRIDDGNDAIFGDLGNDWLVGGTGLDHLYGGLGCDLMNLDDNLETAGPSYTDRKDLGPYDGMNTVPDDPDSGFAGTTIDPARIPTTVGADLAYGGAGRDVLIDNTGADRMIDWVGEFNSFLVPYAPFGQFSISRSLQPFVPDYLYDVSESDGVDPSRWFDTGQEEARNGEPEGELALVLQKDRSAPYNWQDQTGAPADPQAGNIPGGKRDVMEAESFNTGITTKFAVEKGTWTFTKAMYQAAPVNGGDAVSLFYVDQQFPGYYELLATVNANKDRAGVKSNGYLVFDYYSPTDFKFAGLDVGLDKLQIGEVTANGWEVKTQIPMQLVDNVNYSLLVAVNGTNVTLLVNGTKSLSYTFAPRVVDGMTFGLNTGMVGVASNNSITRFDNVTAQKLPPLIVFTDTEDFGDGQANLFTPQGGTWTVTGGRYQGTPAGDVALSTIPIEVSANSFLEFEAKVKTGAQGGVVFDYYGPHDFKFAALLADTDQVVIGHRTSKGWFYDAVVSKTVDAGKDYTLTVSLLGSQVNVSLNGSLVVSKTFNAVVTDGAVGLLAKDGGVSFDDVVIKGDDPNYQIGTDGAYMVAAGKAAPSAGGETLTQAALQPIAAAAEDVWSQYPGLDAVQLAALQQVNFQIADLNGRILGETVGNTVKIDTDAAGFGWFVDLTPLESSEFSQLGGGLLAPAGSPAYGAMDLMTVVTHELGHVLGFTHSEPLAVMEASLKAGERAAAVPEPAAAPRGLAKARAVLTEKLAMVFDEKRGEFMPPGLSQALSRLDANLLRVQPTHTGAEPEEDDWIVAL